MLLFRRNEESPYLVTAGVEVEVLKLSAAAWRTWDMDQSKSGQISNTSTDAFSFVRVSPPQLGYGQAPSMIVTERQTANELGISAICPQRFALSDLPGLGRGLCTTYHSKCVPHGARYYIVFK